MPKPQARLEVAYLNAPEKLTYIIQRNHQTALIHSCQVKATQHLQSIFMYNHLFYFTVLPLQICFNAATLAAGHF